MKKYYAIRLYQVSKHKGYFSHCEKYKEMTVFKSSEEKYKMEAEYTLVDTKQILIVEKIFPYLVREIKTGIIFPIINLKKDKYYSEDTEYIHYPYNLVHTFVISKENKLLATEVTSPKQLEAYDKLHPSAENFKIELLDIYNQGKINMKNQLLKTIDMEYQVSKEVKKEQEEKNKIKSLIYRFKQDRRNI